MDKSNTSITKGLIIVIILILGIILVIKTLGTFDQEIDSKISEIEHELGELTEEDFNDFNPSEIEYDEEGEAETNLTVDLISDIDVLITSLESDSDFSDFNDISY